jgi:type II secretory pathway pseudopilin PulG
MVVPVGYSPVLAVSVRDQEAVAAGLYRLESLLQGVLAGAGGVTLERAQKGDRSYWTLKSEELPVAPTLMLTKSWLAIAVNPPALEGLVLREAGEQGRWVPDELVQGALSELPGEFGSISVSDPVPTYRQMFETLPMALLVLNSQVLPNLGEGLELPFGLEDMPAAESVLEPMFPNVSVGYATEGGYAWKTRQSVPGTPVGNLSAGAVGGVLVALLLPAVQQAREAARRTQSKNNLRTIGLALHNYHDVFGHFPRGTPEQPDRPVEERLSWAYELLPYLEEAVAYEGADREQGWAGQGNAELIGKKFDVFRNPSQPGQREYESAGDYVAIAGVGANAAELPDNDLKAGIFGYDRKTSFRSVTDGTSNTMMVADSSQPNVSMFAGGKPTVRGFSQQPYLNGPDGIGSPHPGIVHVLMADGSVRALAVETDPQIIEALATKAGGEVVGDF